MGGRRERGRRLGKHVPIGVLMLVLRNPLVRDLEICLAFLALDTDNFDVGPPVSWNFLVNTFSKRQLCSTR